MLCSCKVSLMNSETLSLYLDPLESYKWWPRNVMWDSLHAFLLKGQRLFHLLHLGTFSKGFYTLQLSNFILSYRNFSIRHTMCTTGTHTNAHKHTEWVLPAPLRVWGWCLSITACTISILIAVTPCAASTRSPPPPLRFLHPSIHPSLWLPLLFFPERVSQSASTSFLLHSGCTQTLVCSAPAHARTHA